MTVTLTNRSGRLFVAVLAHELFCAAAATCHCTPPTKRGGLRVPSSLTILAGERLSGIDEAALVLPEVRAGLRAGGLIGTRDDPAPAAPEPAPPEPEPAPPVEPAADSDSQPRKKRGSP